MSVHRTTILPRASAIGHLIVAEAVLGATVRILQSAGGHEGPHEGLVWWLGRNVDADTLILAAHAPVTRSGPDFVFATEAATGAAGRVARTLGLGLVAQVHSHPGTDTRHSDGDDKLVLLPYEGMFSLVVARYGTGSILPEQGAGLHQFQAGRWIQVDPVIGVMAVVPSQTDGQR
jgi:proteasome lid subunit RPN8/RPN11